MKTLIVVGLTLALSGMPHAIDKAKKNLQGLWMAVAAEESGKKAIGPRARLLEGMSWEFKGGEFVWRMEGHVELKGAYKINSSKKPKEIDLFDPQRKVHFVGIYELQDGALKIRFNADVDPRAKQFTTEKGTRDHFLLTLERSKSPK